MASKQMQSSFRARSLSPFVVSFTIVCMAAPAALAQSTAEVPLKLGRVVPGSLRATATESWNAIQCEVTNTSDVDRLARVYLFYPSQTEVQFGREIWVPAHATITTWMLAGPPGAKETATSCEVLPVLAEQVDGKERLFLATKERPLLPRRVLYRPTETTTAILLDEPGSEENPHGRIPRAESPSEEALHLARTMRSAAGLSEFVNVAPPGPLPNSADAFAGIDQFVLASDRIARDPAGMEALRRWLQQGGRVWVMLDMIAPETLDQLLGEAIDFQIVDRGSATETRLESLTAAQIKLDPVLRKHDRPVTLVRVILPASERTAQLVNGWPAAFTRQVGRGKILFTTVGPRAWYRPRASKGEPSPYANYPTLPVFTPPLKTIADELKPAVAEDPRRNETWKTLLADDIGYSIIGRRVVLPVFGGLLLVGFAVGLALRNSRRLELWGWTIPLAALAAAGTFLLLGENARGTARPVVAVVQIVEGGTGTEEASIHGLLAAYRPESGEAPIGAAHGGYFDFDMEGIQGQTRRLLRTDLDAWYWDNLALPSGIRMAPFRTVVPAGEPLAVVAHFGPAGLEGQIQSGRFEDVGDAILGTPSGRCLALRLTKDGTFRAGPADVLPSGQYLSGGILTDRQQRRQEVLRQMLQPSALRREEGHNHVLAWAKALDMQFTLAPDAQTMGNALLSLPLRLEHSPPGTKVSIPGPLISLRQIIAAAPIQLTRESAQAGEMRLRFQLPSEVLPVRVESARLLARIEAPSRQVVISGHGDGAKVELHRVSSPLEQIRVEIADERLLQLDDQGGLHFVLTIGEEQSPLGGVKDAREVSQKWRIEDLELEVVGTTKE
jgi:hypothetical protein